MATSIQRELAAVLLHTKEARYKRLDHMLADAECAWHKPGLDAKDSRSLGMLIDSLRRGRELLASEINALNEITGGHRIETSAEVDAKAGIRKVPE